MIIGTGSDIIDIRRIEKSLARFGSRFTERVFTPTERHKSDKRAKAGEKIRASSYAKRFAAKEAVTKALGTGFSNGVFHKSIEVINLPSGKPSIILHGGAKVIMEKLTPSGKTAQIHLTMTDEYPYAYASVIIDLG